MPMKIGLVISTILHVTLLGWGLIVLKPPKSFHVADVEAVPVDIIPVSSITQLQQGAKDAPAREIVAPKPTKRPDPVEDASVIGNNDIDLKAADTEKTAARTVERAEEVPKVEPPKPEPAPVSEPPKETEVASLPKDVAPEPVPEKPDAKPKPEFAPLPDKVPVPRARPKPPKETPKVASREDSDFDPDKIEALLNREDSAGGGAARSTEQAALGAESPQRISESLSISEIDGLRRKIESCWQVVAGIDGAQDVRIQVYMTLNPAGEIDGDLQVDATGGTDRARDTLADSVRRAVLRCAPYDLPVEKYDNWAKVVLNFDPSNMF